ncbi:metallophosphoesterase family protein [Paenibacillus sp. JCM 10914]|uniref:metallophosphoesterase family protein n=1 Tax=Paenibacillus sp. JCM 10914 TaxID=1236974 RepID=UPI000A6B9E89
MAISDIHGCYDEFNQLLDKVKYDPSTDKLILLGDYVDRGMKSKEVVEQVMALKANYGVITLRGNHDQMMLDAILLDTPEHNSRWLRNGARLTIESYTGSDFLSGEMTPEKYAEGKAYIMEHYAHHLAFLDVLDFYYETESHIFVHAGLNPGVPDWKRQPEDDFIWIREPFFLYPTGLAKTVVFGHTPTLNLHETEHIWISPEGDKIGIDGACVYGKQLNCLEMSDDQSYQAYYVKRKLQDESEDDVHTNT